MEYTEEQLQKIKAVRLLIGDVEGSPFYPLFTDDEIAAFLIMENWNVRRAARHAAISAAFIMSTMAYRERTGDIEVWNNASLQYVKVLQWFIDDSSAFSLPTGIMPYAAGISKADMCAADHDPDRVRSPLATIKTCDDWWLQVRGFEKICGCGPGCRP